MKVSNGKRIFLRNSSFAEFLKTIIFQSIVCCSKICNCTWNIGYLRTRSAKFKLKLFFSCILFTFLIFYITSIFFPNELDITGNFSYPMYTDNFKEMVQRFRLGDETIPPINLLYSNVNFIAKPEGFNNATHYGLLLVIKSGVGNIEKRASIRRTWGSHSYLTNTQLSPPTPTKLAFICGIANSYSLLQEEAELHGDIIIGDFIDSYGNNTYKSILSLRWALENYNGTFDYFLLADDDLYMDLENLKNYVQRLHSMSFVEVREESLLPFYKPSTNETDDNGMLLGDEIIQNNGLYSGFVFDSGSPLRSWLTTIGTVDNKWIVPLEVYPYNYYPPYPAGAGVLLSHETLSQIYYASYFVKHFWIDDVFLGILAFKMGIVPIHNSHFLVPGTDQIYERVTMSALHDAIILHGASCPKEMEHIWRTRNLSLIYTCGAVCTEINIPLGLFCIVNLLIKLYIN